MADISTDQSAPSAVKAAGAGQPTARRPKGHPISGVSALFLVVGAASVFLLARWAGQPPENGDGGRTIQGMYGLLVAGLIGVLILGYAWAHHLVGSVARTPLKIWDHLNSALRPLGAAFTAFDLFLVFRIAMISGAGPFKPGRRAVQFLLYFAVALAAAALLPPPWGLLGVVMGLLAILALNRIWAWVEEDRRNYVLNGFYDVSAHTTLGIGFERDHRDVALTSLALLIVFMPLALMQMSAFGFFATKDGSPIEDVRLLEWFVFFGGEMAKSVPFVDWSEVYGAETLTPIEPQTGGGQHTVFLVRALVDLVLLAGFIQAFELSNRLARQKSNFRDPDNPERILDPFLERDAFRDIAMFAAPASVQSLETDLSASLEERLGPFTAYSNQQLQRVLMKGEAPEFWRPEHETAMALIVPFRKGIARVPQFFTQLYEHGYLNEDVGATFHPRAVDARTQVAAIIAVLATDNEPNANARGVALAELPKFLESDDERVWSGAACAVAEIAARPDFPAHARQHFRAALAGDAAAAHPSRTRLLHQALAHLASARRPAGNGADEQPHYDWATDLLATNLREPADYEVRRSAVAAVSTVVFRPGERLDATQRALADLAEATRPRAWSWRRLCPWLRTQRLSRAAARAAATICAFEAAPAPAPAGDAPPSAS